MRGVTVVKRLLLVCGPSEPFSYSRCSCLQKGVFPVVRGWIHRHGDLYVYLCMYAVLVYNPELNSWSVRL